MASPEGTNNPTSPYIVVLDRAADTVRALLFDGEARRVEGYSAQLPVRKDAGADCLDEMHRLVRAAGFRVAAVVGRAESEVTAEDRSYWPAFEKTAWFPSLPEGAGAILGSGCLSCERFGLAIGEPGMLGTVTGARPVHLTAGLTCAAIGENRWLLRGEVPEAGAACASLRHEMKGKGSLERYLETAGEDDPELWRIDAVARRFREMFEVLAQTVGSPVEVIACGAALVQSPSLTQRLANAIGVPLTLCTEPEPAMRGAALWALERTGSIAEMGALPASTATVFAPGRTQGPRATVTKIGRRVAYTGTIPNES